MRKCKYEKISEHLQTLFYKTLDLSAFWFCISEKHVREKMCIWKKYEQVYFKSNTFSLRLQDSVYKILLLVPSENRRIWISYLFCQLGQELCSFCRLNSLTRWSKDTSQDLCFNHMEFLDIEYKQTLEKMKSVLLLWSMINGIWLYGNGAIFPYSPQQPAYIAVQFAKSGEVLSENWKWRHAYER